MGNRRKKYERGEATLYLTRKQAVKKLQLSLKSFRYVCILKGVYPREPRNWKRAQKGNTDKKTLYYKKDIQFLLHEPIIWKLRDLKVYLRTKEKAIRTKDKERVERLKENHPVFSIDHIIKERYPTFLEAIRDLDDCLTLLFLFSTFPKLHATSNDMAHLSRRLTMEFLHFIIESRSLRKVFISIKGYYFQAEIKTETITWIVPHNYGFQPQAPSEVDFKVMANFVEFYSTFLGFINFRLYHSINLYYPPRLPGTLGTEMSDAERDMVSQSELANERIFALNESVRRSAAVVEDEVEIEDFAENEGQASELRTSSESLKRLKSLFEGTKFFLGREVPRENLTFVIRAFGGQVSWDKTLFIGATYGEADESITHQVIDRPITQKQHLSRYYIQPQWVFDSINARQLLPVQNYFPDAMLPPHLCPFVEERPGEYVPPEKKEILQGKTATQKSGDSSDDDEVVTQRRPKYKRKDPDDIPKGQEMAVKSGTLEKIDPEGLKTVEEREHYRLRVMMIKRKEKRLYRSMMKSKKRRQKESNLLTSKREQLDRKNKLLKKKIGNE